MNEKELLKARNSLGEVREIWRLALETASRKTLRKAAKRWMEMKGNNAMTTEELKAQLAATQAALTEAVNALEHLLALYMHTVYGSYNGKAEQPTPVEQARKIIQEHKP